MITFTTIVIIIGLILIAITVYIVYKSIKEEIQNPNAYNIREQNKIYGTWQSNVHIAKVETTKTTQQQISSNYITNNKVMTQTEFAFYKDLKKIANKYSLDVFPQVDLKSIIKQKYKNDIASLNKINRKSIDYTLVRNDTGLIICCIELDDNSHLRADRQKSDNFKNQIFKELNIPLIRQIPKNIYTIADLENLEKQIIHCLNDRQNS